MANGYLEAGYGLQLVANYWIEKAQMGKENLELAGKALQKIRAMQAARMLVDMVSVDSPKKTVAETGASTINGVTPTAADIKLIYALITSFNSKPDVDWDNVTTATSSNSAKS
ncbi:hypothetical protein N656DRAFT_768060 [Canariomyces notabilis]|uniref:Uncharacterized protein n=1 Tax=Canariomyces notabilis TaxID=2074819 RepID=A0AAN6TEQ2_9PEZI|nr:hypothetical protein N656DRAFT_768060 [Canariomyces arenarius]